jgi:hypothetical protein
VKPYITLCAAAVFCALASCEGGPSPAKVPDWALDIRKVYPDSEFITGRGEGPTRQDAEQNALAEISYFFSSEVTAERSRRDVFSTKDDVTTEIRQTKENVIVQSHIRLTTVRYAEDAFYDRAVKAWRTLAYINRDEAWTVYEPNAKQQADALLALFKAAEAESDVFNAVLRYGAIGAYADSAEFNATRDFAQTLNPAKSNALFREADAALAGYREKLFSVREKVRVYVECSVDYNRMIYQAMVKALGASGFAVEENRNRAGVRCVIHVEEGMLKQGNGTFYTPALSGTISGNAGALFSFSVKGERKGALTNPDLAKRNAYTALATALEKSFPVELQNRLSVGVQK